MGNSICGQLGHNSVYAEHSPRMVVALRGVHIAGTAASCDYSLALANADTVFSWGDNFHGQEGSVMASSTVGTLW